MSEPPFRADPGPAGTRFAEIRRFEEIDSTNRDLADLARRGARPLVAAAAHQTAGRGRLGRRWEAPPGANLLASVLVPLTLDAQHLHLCSTAVSLAAADAVVERCRAEGLGPLEVVLKWPNDLLVGGRKLAGVLAESVPSGGGRWAVVVGVGVNVDWPGPDGGPPELADVATSVRRETGKGLALDALLDSLLRSLEPRLTALEDAPGRLSVASEYRIRCATVGQRVRVETSSGDIVGVGTDITPEGHLVVDQGACFATIVAGDVVHLRSAQ